MQKVLLIHNNYQITGGEDTNIIDEVKMLQKNFIVETLIFSNKKKFDIYDLFSFILGFNIKSDKIIKKKLNEFNPDFVYIHNVWYKISFGIFNILKKNKIKTIVKIHNFRYECSQSWLIKNHIKPESICNACSNTRLKFQIFNKYFSESYLKSIFSIIFSKRFLKILIKNPIKVLVISNFHKKKIILNGVNSEKVELFNNPLNFDLENTTKYNPDSDYVVYAGRISSSKGVEELINSYLASDLKEINLKIIGDGELFSELKEKYHSDQILFLGNKSLRETYKEISNARAVVSATKMYEGQPRLLTEASSMKIPSIYPSFGSMDEFFPNDYELSFEQFNYLSLTKKLNLIEDKTLLSKLSSEVYDYVEAFISDIHLQKKLKILLNNE